MSTVTTKTTNAAPFAELPPDLSPTDTDFISIVNDRLRRIAGSMNTPVAAVSSASGSGSTPGADYQVVTPNSLFQIVIDLGFGPDVHIVLDATTATTVLPITTLATFLTPVWTGGAIVKGAAFNLYIDQDAVGNHPCPLFAAAGYMSDVGLQSIDGTPGTRSIYMFKYHGTRWGFQSFRTGGATT